jgi:hypothetical protein
MNGEIVRAREFDECPENDALDKNREMIPERLRPLFAEERRPLLIRHVVFALALIPIPWFRTGVVDLLVMALLFPWPHLITMALAFLFWLSLFSLPLIPLFLAWSLPSSGRPRLPKRSIVFLVLLIAYHPFRFYLEGRLYVAETQAFVARIHEQFPIVWAFKHLDTPLLLGLVVWTILRRRTVRPAEKIWLHWLLFVCALWAAGAFYDFSVGDSLSLIFD